MSMPRPRPEPPETMLRITPGWAVLMVLLAGALVLGLAIWNYRSLLLGEERAKILARQEVFGHALGFAVERRVALLEGVRSLVQHGLQQPHQAGGDHFRDFSRHLMESVSGIRNISIAPDGVQDRIFPHQGNEIVAGHDLLRDPRSEVRRTVARALEQRTIVLQGPYPLRQGGTGLAARLAVYEQGRFWGLVCMVIDWPVVLEEAGFGQVPEDLQLTLLDGEGRVVFGRAEVLTAAPVREEIPLIRSGWTLAAAPAAGWESRIAPRLMWFIAAGAALVSLLTIVVYLLARQRVQLVRQVALRTAGLKRELAARRHSERAEKSTRETLQAFIDALPGSAILMKPDGTVLVANQTVRRQWQIDPEDPDRNDLFAALPATTALDLKLSVDEAVRSGRSVRFVETVAGRTLAHHLHPLAAADDESQRLALLGIDISERQALENHLRQNQKLEAVGTLSSGVAHEFNNILTTIVGQASLLEMKLKPASPLQSHVAGILRVCDRASNLTRSLLSFSRQNRSEPRVIAVGTVMNHLTELLRPLLAPRLRLIVDQAEEDLHVLADPGLIEQTLVNLALNAQDAMMGEGILRLVTATATLDAEFCRNAGGAPGRYARLTVADNGPGMDKEVQCRIFEPFFTTKDPDRGTGLGLSIALGIAQQHDGLLLCDSEPGHGTAFDLYLPLVTATSKAAPSLPSAGAADASAEKDRHEQKSPHPDR